MILGGKGSYYWTLGYKGPIEARPMKETLGCSVFSQQLAEEAVALLSYFTASDETS
jgi:hypothetical protein